MRFATATYCDDVRQEVGGKSTLVGIYNGALGTAQFPCFLPKLCAIVQLVTPKGSNFEHIVLTGKFNGETIFVMDMGREELDEVEKAAPFTDPAAKYSSLQLMAILSPFQVQEPGRFTIEIVADGEEIYCPSLRMIKADSAEQL